MVMVGQAFGGTPAQPLSPEALAKRAIAMITAIVSSAERTLMAASETDKRGDVGTARILRKRARDKARAAMKKMGPVHFGLGVDMTELGARARSVWILSKSGTGGA
jgi:hypothetical protein